MRGIGGEGNQDEEEDSRVRGGELRRREDDRGLEKIENSGDRRSPAIEDNVGDIAGEERSDRGNERDKNAEVLEAHVVQIQVIHLLNVPEKPLIDALTHRA